MTASLPTLCPACAAPFTFDEKASIPYAAGPSVPAGVNVPTQIHFCRQCQVGVGHPLFTEADEAAIYETGEFWKTAPSRIHLRSLAVPLAQAEERLGFIQNLAAHAFPDGVRILDIGAGQGALGLVAALNPKIRLASYSAVDPDRRLLNDLQGLWKRLELTPELHCAESLIALAPPPGSFDLIVLSHVVEHLREPAKVLDVVKPLLSLKGKLFIELPCQDFRFKPDLFPHILFFNRSNLETLLKRNGFHIEDVGVFGRDYRVNPLGKNISLRDRVTRKTASKLSGLLPLAAQKAFYKAFFGINRRDENGVWLRVAARPTEPDDAGLARQNLSKTEG